MLAIKCGEDVWEEVLDRESPSEINIDFMRYFHNARSVGGGGQWRRCCKISVLH